MPFLHVPRRLPERERGFAAILTKPFRRAVVFETVGRWVEEVR
jgi:hypothetical protein